jgi:hypothetical protein
METWRRKTPGKIIGKRGNLEDYTFWIPQRALRGDRFNEACFVLEDDSEILISMGELRKALDSAGVRQLWVGPFKIDAVAQTVHGIAVQMEVKWASA